MGNFKFKENDGVLLKNVVVDNDTSFGLGKRYPVLAGRVIRYDTTMRQYLVALPQVGRSGWFLAEEMTKAPAAGLLFGDET